MWVGEKIVLGADNVIATTLLHNLLWLGHNYISEQLDF
jgi:hypothetical protein